MELYESVKKQNRIVMRLAKQVIATTSSENSNLIFSPALLNVILSFMAAKSSGAARDQILSLLDASSIDELKSVSSEIVTRVLADSTARGGPTVFAANGLWIDKSLPVIPSFKDLVEKTYHAAFNQVDFRTKADEVTEEINSWVKEQTNGLITNLLAPKSVSPITDLIFANALFFNGRWDKQFDPLLTKDSDFHRLDGTKVRVPFMTRDTFGFRLKLYQGFKVLDLPYRQGRRRSYSSEDEDSEAGTEDYRIFSMKIYLPDEKDGLPAMLDKLASTPGILNDKFNPSHPAASIRELKIPRFKFSFDFEASKALKSLGLGSELKLETIIHKSCIEVDEVGSKAAAAAALMCHGAAMPPKEKYDFVADHPFLFLVKEYRSDLVLFLGQVIDPSLH